MGYLTKYTSNYKAYKLNSDQLGLIPSSYVPKTKRSKRQLLVIIVILLLILIIVGIYTIFKKVENNGSKSGNDYISFMKIYQYGKHDEKKEVNINLPSNYTYAYEVLTGTSLEEKKSQYANALLAAYKKYDNQKDILSSLLIYKGYAMLYSNVISIKNLYVDSGSEHSSAFIEGQISEYQTIDIGYLEKQAELIKTYLKTYHKYLKELDKSGCIQNKVLNYDCEVTSRQDYEKHNDLFILGSKLDGYDQEVRESYNELMVYMDRNILTLYKTKILKEGLKK